MLYISVLIIIIIIFIMIIIVIKIIIINVSKDLFKYYIVNRHISIQGR